jgi:hypothetical protein
MTVPLTIHKSKSSVHLSSFRILHFPTVARGLPSFLLLSLLMLVLSLLLCHRTNNFLALVLQIGEIVLF